jgi:hypothetical protein
MLILLDLVSLSVILRVLFLIDFSTREVLEIRFGDYVYADPLYLEKTHVNATDAAMEKKRRGLALAAAIVVCYRERYRELANSCLLYEFVN